MLRLDVGHSRSFARSPLQNFRVGDPGICHVGVDRPSVPTVARPRPTANRLVVAKALVSKGEVVHTPAARRAGVERPQNHVRDTLAR